MSEMRKDAILLRVVWDRDLGAVKDQVKLTSGAECFRQKRSKCEYPEAGVCLVYPREGREAG